MDYWGYVNTGMVINEDSLPENLPGDDSLALVILGQGLKPDGSMKDELIRRLKVGFDCSKQYPNAYVVCTGGGTAKENKEVTEAGQMGAWLLENGKYYAQIHNAKFELSEFQQKALKQNNQQPCDIIAGIRPCHILLDEGELTAKVEVSEMLGNEVNLHTDCEGDHVVMVIPTMNLETDVSMGKTIRFSTQPRLIQLFDKQTQNNLIWYNEASAKANAPVCKEYNF